jgi:hypothetical protein
MSTIERNALQNWALSILQCCYEGDQPWNGTSDSQGPPDTIREMANCLQEHERGHPQEEVGGWTEEFCPFCSIPKLAKDCVENPKMTAVYGRVDDGTVAGAIMDLLQYGPNDKLYVAKTLTEADLFGPFTEYYKLEETWIHGGEETIGFPGHDGKSSFVLLRIPEKPFHREDECGDPI